MKLRLVGASTYMWKGYHFIKGGGDLQALNKEDHEYLMEQEGPGGAKLFKEVPDNAPADKPKGNIETGPESTLDTRRVPAADRIVAKRKFSINKKGEGDTAAVPEMEAQPEEEAEDAGEGAMELNGTGVKV